MAKMYSNNNQTSVSWGGDVYEAVDGVFDVPEAAVGDLMGHGLIPGELPPPASQPTVTKPVAQWTNDALLQKAADLKLTLDPDIQRPDLIKAVADALKA